MRKVEMFTGRYGGELQDNINNFGKTHKIVQIAPGTETLMMWVLYENEEEDHQIHPKKSKYANLKGNCLHLWRKKEKL